MKAIIYFLPILSFFFVTCNNNSNFDNEESEDLVSFLIDSLNIFENVNEFKMNKKIIENDSLKVIFYSVSKNNFLVAMKENKKNIQLFNRNHKLNEKIEFRFKNKLVLKNKNDSIFLADLPYTKLNRPVAYYMQGRIEDFYIVKKIHFEDSETCFYNVDNLNLEKKLFGITSSFNTNKSIGFYINNFFVFPEEKSQLSFLKMDRNKINYLLNVKVNWFSSFSFFDNENNLFYIHSYYDEDLKIKSTFAKMEYYLKE